MVYPNLEHNKLYTLREIKALLFLSGIIKDDSIIIEAKVPVLKCIHADSGINIDIIIATEKGSESRVR